MKTFNIGTNNYYHVAHVSLDEVPFVLFYLGELMMWFCSKVPDIPLPNWPYKSEDGWTTLRDWYGDTQQLFHIYICEPFTRIVWKHTKTKRIDLPYQYLQKLFPDSFEEPYTFEEDQDFIDLTEEWAILQTHSFKHLQKKLNYKHIKKVCTEQMVWYDDLRKK